jgi:N-acyl-D-aspartate/D-glutamate deacylase
MKQRSAVPSTAEMAELENLVETAMREGALGLSTGLVYVPGTFAKTEEIASLARVVAKENGLYVSHLRDEGSKGREALEEAIFIGEQTGVRVHVSHFKAQGPTEWGSAESRLQLVQAANEPRCCRVVGPVPIHSIEYWSRGAASVVAFRRRPRFSEAKASRSRDSEARTK